jgi:hypothetical protein
MTGVTTLLLFCLPDIRTDGLTFRLPPAITTDRRCPVTQHFSLMGFLDVQVDQQSYCQHLPHAVSSLINNHRALPTQTSPVRTSSDSAGHFCFTLTPHSTLPVIQPANIQCAVSILPGYDVTLTYNWFPTFRTCLETSETNCAATLSKLETRRTTRYGNLNSTHCWHAASIFSQKENTVAQSVQ